MTEKLRIVQKGVTLELEGLGYGDVRLTAHKGVFVVTELVARADVERIGEWIAEHLADAKVFGR